MMTPRDHMSHDLSYFSGPKTSGAVTPKIEFFHNEIGCIKEINLDEKRILKSRRMYCNLTQQQFQQMMLTPCLL